MFADQFLNDPFERNTNDRHEKGNLLHTATELSVGRDTKANRWTAALKEELNEGGLSIRGETKTCHADRDPVHARIRDHDATEGIKATSVSNPWISLHRIRCRTKHSSEQK